MDPHNHGPERGEWPAPGPESAHGRRDLSTTVLPGDGGIVPPAQTSAVVVPPHGLASVPRPARHDPPPAAHASDDPDTAAGGPRDAAGGGTARRLDQVVAGDHLLTVDPAGGSEVAGCPPERLPAVRRRTPAERAARAREVRPAPPAGPPRVQLPLLERDELSERLVRLIGHGRSVRVSGPCGSGRSTLLNAVAERCADLAPDGVIRLSAYRRTPGDLLQELYAAVHRAEGYRPERGRLLDAVRRIGAVVVLDDVEFGGAPLGELLAAAPECAFLFSATPDTAAPPDDAHVEEVPLPRLSRGACTEVMERVAERPLTEEESTWAEGLWFSSEGLPLRFVQAGALLRSSAAGGQERIPLPSLVRSAAPAQLLAARLSHNAHEALRVAVALGGECVHQSHLPALVGVESADGALGELIACGLATAVAGHHRLAVGVVEQLGGAESTDYAVSAARHYAWWAGHPSVLAVRVAAEADAILAAMAACRDNGNPDVAVALARAAAPEFASALNWSVWERALRIGQESARMAGAVGDEAHFHHELGILALCSGNPERARTELEASIGMRGVLGDRRGALVGRRALALVDARSAATELLPVRTPPAPVPTRASGAVAARPPAVRRRAHALPPGGTAAPAVVHATGSRPAALHRRQHRRRFAASRRNLAAAGVGAVLVALLGTVATFAATSDAGRTGPQSTGSGGAAAQNDRSTPLDPPTRTAGSGAGAGSASPSASASATHRVHPTAAAAAPTAPGVPGTPTGPVTGGPGPTHLPPTQQPTAPPGTPPPTTAPPVSPPPSTTPPPVSPSPSSSSSTPAPSPTGSAPAVASPGSATGSAPAP